MLEVKGLEVRYGPVRAVHGVDLAVAEGEIVALLGPNGAGKSSTILGIMGLVPETKGEVRFAGRSLRGMATEDIARLGVSLVFEGRRVFKQLSVEENLRLGTVAGAGRSEPAARRREILSLFPVLAERADQAAGTLSGGEQQMLAIGRALMASPKLMLLDEPSLGLAPRLVDEVFGMIGRLREMGVTVLLVEQNVQMSLEIADRALVMSGGRIVRSAAAAELLASDGVEASYLGHG